MTDYIHCPFCNIDFPFDGRCNSCGRDREGFTEEDRMKPPRKEQVADSYLIDIKKSNEQKKKKQERPKWDNDPFPGSNGKIRIIKRGA